MRDDARIADGRHQEARRRAAEFSATHEARWARDTSNRGRVDHRGVLL